MENTSLLPKNIRQIGTIQGRRKICLEDYVMTYIRKMESPGNGEFLGLLLGERKSAGDLEYIYVRGIMAVPDSSGVLSHAGNSLMQEGRMEEDLLPDLTPGEEKEIAAEQKEGLWQKVIGKRSVSKKPREALSGKKQAAEGTREALSGKKQAAEESPEALSGKKQAAEGIREALSGKKRITEESRETVSEKKTVSKESRETVSEKKTVSKEPREAVSEKNNEGKKQQAAEPWDRLKAELEERFPGCEIQGCCAIGTYPAGRLEELFGHFPSARQMLYHLQDQEERLYWLEGEQYEGVSGYFVFYEQNPQMQAYLAETFGKERAESEEEGVSDGAITRFREKVKSKAEEKSQSFMKLASSFFVVGVLIIGVIAVNRAQDLQQLKRAVSTAELTSVSDSQSQSEGETQNAGEAADAEVSSRGVEKATNDAVNSQDVEEVTDDDADNQNAEELTGDDAQTTAAAAQAETETTDTDTRSAAASTAADTQSDPEAADSADSSAVILSGSDAFWADDTEDDSPGTADEVAENTAADADDEADEADAGLLAGTSSTATAAAEASGRQVQAAYIIREGDTLAGICALYYGSLDYLEELCEANGIEDADLIHPGQKIVLP